MTDDRQSIDRTKRPPRAPAVLRYEDGTSDEVWPPLRERAHSRVAKGAETANVPVDDLSNRQRRLLSAVTDLPQLWQTNRTDRSDSEILSRDLTALRARLDWLEHMEAAHGDEQRGASHNRAERNALIRLLQQHAESIGIEVTREPARAGKKYKPEYVREVEDMAREAIADGYTVTEERRPGVLMHSKGDGIAPIEVPVGVWFVVRGYARARLDPGVES